MNGTVSGGVKEEEPLCCCEYWNEDGEISHLLACCCNCEAIDEACDRGLFRCEKVPQTAFDRTFASIVDRCRVPSASGEGAAKVRLDVAVPVVTVPSCLLLATIGPVATVFAFICMASVLGVSSLALSRTSSKRSPFFFVWSLTSVVCCYLVFQVIVVSFREVLLWEILLLFTSTSTMLYVFYYVKGDPGYVRSPKRCPYQITQGDAGPLLSNGKVLHAYDPSGACPKRLPNGPGHVAVSVCNGSTPYDLYLSGADAGSCNGLKSDSLCPHCLLRRPPRAGHCPQCDACVAVRDHHCVWINHCVGAQNHRCFLAAMVLCVWNGLYGVQLSMSTVCAPIMVYDWFLVPYDCSYLYQNFYTSAIFVAVLYTAVATVLVGLTLLRQLVLISQNLTSRELCRARRQGHAVLCLFVGADRNANNAGILRNWLHFLFRSSRSAATS